MRSFDVALPSLNTAWRWWSGEIAALIPSGLRRRLAGREGRLLLVMTADSAGMLVHRAGDDEAVLAGIDLDPARAAESREIIAAIRSRIPGIGHALTIRLPAEAGLRTSMVLPLAAAGNLAEVVSFELDRRTPFKSDEIYFTHRLLRREPAQQRLVVELTVAPRSIVDHALSLAESIGLEVEAVEVASAQDDMTPPGNLLPPRPQRLGARLPRLGIAGLAAAAAALAAVAVFLPIYQADQTADALAAELAAAKQQAGESLALQKEIDAEIQESGFLATRKRDAPAVSEVLYRLTRILPDDSWLTELQFANPDVQITGLAASASTILGLLDQSPGFTNATFRSSVMQDQRSGHEQFNIGVRVQRPKTP